MSEYIDLISPEQSSKAGKSKLDELNDHRVSEIVKKSETFFSKHSEKMIEESEKIVKNKLKEKRAYNKKKNLNQNEQCE